MRPADDFDFLAVTDGPWDVRDVAWPTDLPVLYLAPHPDDFDCVAVTMRHLARNGNRIDVAVVRTGSGVEDEYLPSGTLTQLADIREAEQRRSLEFFGLAEAQMTFLRTVNDDLDQAANCPENVAMVIELLTRLSPGLVVLPHWRDTNTGHQQVYRLLTQAAEQLGQPFAALLCCDPKTIDLRIDLYLPFDPTDADWKAEMLRFHDTQHQRNLRTRGHGLDDRILDTNRATADRLGLDAPFAEAFEFQMIKVPG